MKLSAITSRSTRKDYVDLYAIMPHVALADMLALVEQKMPTLDRNLVLKSLVYFDDVDTAPIHYMPGHAVPFETVTDALRARVEEYIHARG